MDISLCDAFSGFGGATPGDVAVVQADDIAADLVRFAIERALVRIVPEELETDVIASNERLYAACTAHPALLPCPIVVPHAEEKLSEEAQVAELVARGASAVWIRPTLDYWSLAPWCCDGLFRALAHRHVPVLAVESMVGLEQVATLAERHPTLPLLLAGANYRQQRLLLPLLHTFSNMYLLLGGAYAVHGGLEQVVKHVGATRILFGTGYPRTEPMAAITYLMYAAISEEEKRLIGAENLTRLLAEVER